MNPLWNAYGAAYRIRNALDYLETDLVAKNPAIATHLKASVLQGFETLFECSVKSLRKYLVVTEGDAEFIHSLTFNQLIRLGAERGLLSQDISCWRSMRDWRRQTLYILDEPEKFGELLEAMPTFIEEMVFLQNQVRYQASHDTQLPILSVRPQDLAIVQLIVRRCLPLDARIWVFGSRAKGTTRRGADLDLAVDAGRRLKQAERIALGEAFEESDLPYTVDVVDMHEVSEQFRAIIDEHKIVLPR